MGRLEIKKIAQGVDGNELNVYLIEYESDGENITTSIVGFSVTDSIMEFFLTWREF